MFHITLSFFSIAAIDGINWLRTALPRPWLDAAQAREKAALRFGERGVGLCERDGGELNIRTGYLCARSHFSPTARYFRYLTDNLRALVL